MSRDFLAVDLAPGVELSIMKGSTGLFSASVGLGKWPDTRKLTCTVFEAGQARVDAEDQPPSLWLDRTNIELPWAELLKVADFLLLEIPTPAGTQVPA